MKKILVLLPLISVLLLAPSCDVLRQIEQMGMLTQCQFRLESVKGLNLAGVNIQNVKKLTDLSVMDGIKLASLLKNDKAPLDFTLNLQGRNPNRSPAGMTQMEWILMIDNIEMTKGLFDKAVTIPADSGIAVIPMKMQVDLREALAGKSANAILNFALNLAGAGDKPSRFTLRMRPTITISGYPITYPGFIDIGTEFGHKAAQ